MNNKGFTIPEFLLFLCGFVILILLIWTGGYRSGQIDALSGDIMYERVVTDKVTWELTK